MYHADVCICISIVGVSVAGTESRCTARINILVILFIRFPERRAGDVLASINGQDVWTTTRSSVPSRILVPVERSKR